MKISIIIPNYNGEELLKKNLPSVLSSVEYFQNKKNQKVEIIVVDDCSSDQSLEFLRSQDIKLIENKRNVGFAYSVNRAVEQASGEIVILLNSDVSPEKDFLIPLVAHFEDKNVFAVGCMDKSMEKEKIILRGRGIGKWHRGFLMHRRGEVDKMNTLWVNGGSGAFRKSIWEKLGGFNTLYYPFYWEDIDLSYRALKEGYRVLFEPQSVVVHEHEKGSIKKKYSSFQVKEISYKNQFLFVWLNITDLPFQLQHLAYMPYHLLAAFIRGDIAFFLGFLKACMLIPQVIILRFKKQKIFVKTDRNVLSEFTS